jgi:hypothetical protein
MILGGKYKKILRGFDGTVKKPAFCYMMVCMQARILIYPREFFSRDFIDFCFKPYKEMLPCRNGFTS